MTDTTPSPGGVLVWPAKRFYWAVLDAPGVTAAGLLPPGLLVDLADEVPLPVEEVHPVCVPLSGSSRDDSVSQLVVCAARRCDLAALPSQALALLPAEVIGGGPGGAVEARGMFNLLIGAFEPASIRRLRQRRRLTAIAAVCALTTLGAIGFIRRAAHWDAAARDARTAAARLLEGVLPPGAPAAQLPAELARLQHASTAAGRFTPPRDAAAALAALLKQWPLSPPSEPQSITVSENGMSISVLIEQDHASFVRAFAPPPGWTILEPRLTGSAGITRLVIELMPTESPPQAASTPEAVHTGTNGGSR